MFFKKRKNRNDRYNITENDNISESMNDGYLEELEKKFSEFNTQLESDEETSFKLSSKYKLLLGVITLAVAMIVLVFIFIVMPNFTQQSREEKKVVKKLEIVEDEEEVPLATIDPHKGMVKSMYTGTWIREELQYNRPYAIMFNNIKAASPQSGTSYADIMYEAVVEGGITRMMGIYTRFPKEKIGSIRSARPYFVSIAKEYDAIYIHMGGSNEAKSKIASLEVADLDGIKASGAGVIYRDSSVRAPHNAFTNSKRILGTVQQKGFRTTYEGKENNHFEFHDEFTDILGGSLCNKVSIFFTSYTQPYFVYNDKSKTYLRYQFGRSHIDRNTGKQLAYTNIIIQYVNEWTADSAGRQAMDIYESAGKGLYISGGKYEEITWTRSESRLTMQYKDATGNLLTINPGRTYIALVPRENKTRTIIN